MGTWAIACTAGKFEDEIHPGLKHTGAGILSMVRLPEYWVCMKLAAVDHGARAGLDLPQHSLDS